MLAPKPCGSAKPLKRLLAPLKVPFVGIPGNHDSRELIATGHVHRATLTMFAGIPTTICPAPNHAVDLDLDHLREPSFKVEPPAFHLHSWFPGEGFGSVVTHQAFIGDFDGPHFLGPMASCFERANS